jgi:competence protein ComEC
MLIFNPLLMHHDIGFQLSFLAVLGIIYIYPIFEKFKQKILNISEIKKCRKLISTLLSLFNISLAAYLSTLPLILLHFKQMYLLSPFVNVLVVFLFPLLFVLLILAIIFSFIFPGLIYYLFYPAYLCLKYIYELAKFFSSFNLFIIEIDRMPILIIILYYIILITFVVYINKKNKKEKNNYIIK